VARLKYNWIKNGPLQIDALAAAGKVLFAAATSEGSNFKLLSYAIEDGRLLSELPLPAAPNFDGIAVAQSRLYLTLKDGSVLCLEPGNNKNR